MIQFGFQFIRLIKTLSKGFLVPGIGSGIGKPLAEASRGFKINVKAIMKDLIVQWVVVLGIVVIFFTLSGLSYN
jgi:hypothetical protein